MANLGKLQVVLGGDKSELDKVLSGAQASFAAFGKGVAVAAAAVATAVVAAGAAIGVALHHSLEEGDKLGKMSQSIGIPVDELSRLKLAADLSDVSVESLGKSVAKLSKGMVDAASGGTGPAAE